MVGVRRRFRKVGIGVFEDRFFCIFFLLNRNKSLKFRLGFILVYLRGIGVVSEFCFLFVVV